MNEFADHDYDRDYEPPGYVDIYQPIATVGSAYRSYDSPSPYKVGKYTIPYLGKKHDHWLGHYGHFGYDDNHGSASNKKYSSYNRYHG